MSRLTRGQWKAIYGEGADESPLPEEREHDYELTPEHDHAKSFYRKAMVRIHPDGSKTLRSYDTDVAELRNGKAYVKGAYSPTTLRHIKEFLLQHSYPATSKKQIEKDYRWDRED
jgi:hypothetical protein